MVLSEFWGDRCEPLLKCDVVASLRLLILEDQDPYAGNISNVIDINLYYLVFHTSFAQIAYTCSLLSVADEAL